MLHTSEFALKSWIILCNEFIVLSLIGRFLISKNSEKLKITFIVHFWFICAIICVLILKFYPFNDSQLKDHQS